MIDSIEKRILVNPNEAERTDFGFPKLEGEYLFDDKPTPLSPDQIYHYHVVKSHEDKGKLTNGFVLEKNIAGFTYRFRLIEMRSPYTYYTAQMDTKEFGYSRTQLTDEQRDEVIAELAKFIDTVTRSGPDIKGINMVPAEPNYTVKMILDCREKILAHPNNTLSAEEIIVVSEGDNAPNCFELYQELYGQTYPGYTREKHDIKRKKVFVPRLEAMLQEWDVVAYDGVAEFDLVRKYDETN